MRIAHISDLHFGEHQPLLAASLRDRISALKPDLVICSGDVADDTREDLTDDARVFLDELAERCAETDGPRLIVVPGNHDVRKNGWLYRSRGKPYTQAFGQAVTDHYYARHNTWVFGFDSAMQGTAGGSGYISDKDLEVFHGRYEALSKTEGFVNAFKIVVVHHHPLPVNWDHNRADRWLTMTNAGKFLSAVLFRKVDLVLHGHEHFQARARLWSTLGANDHQTTVVSLGATLRKVDAPDRNWFGIIDIDPRGVRLNFHASVGGTAFNEHPEPDTFWIRSPQAAEDRTFDRWREERGFFYRALSSVTMLDRDGDSRRSIECDDLTFRREPADWAQAVTIALPHTSGYLDDLRVKGGAGPRPAALIPDDSQLHDFRTAITFDQPPGVDQPTDFVVGWNSVNSYAMDRRQFDHMYQGGPDQPLDNIEFTHYVVCEPIEQLTVVARFPEGFVPINPRLRVAKAEENVPPRSWKTVREVERTLKEEYSLRFFDSIRIASLRVRRPKEGLSYGIQWELPEPERREPDLASIEMDEIVNKLLAAPTAHHQQMTEMLRLLIETSRVLLMPTATRGKGWVGKMEASLMIFDADRHALKVVAAVNEERGTLEPLDYSKITLNYGDGIGGRAFKANQIRVFVRDLRSGPRYYREMPDVPPHAVLVSIPVQAPAADRKVWAPYAVLSLGSTSLGCPLRLIQPDRSEWQSKLSAYKEAADLKLHEALAQIWL